MCVGSFTYVSACLFVRACVHAGDCRVIRGYMEHLHVYQGYRGSVRTWGYSHMYQWGWSSHKCIRAVELVGMPGRGTCISGDLVFGGDARERVYGSRRYSHMYQLGIESAHMYLGDGVLLVCPVGAHESGECGV
ncbi:hypothetical protein MAR_031571, partial [Mya arenaria]